MNPRARAVVSWITKDQGGRTRPPTGPKYMSPVRFDGDQTWPKDVWSMVVELVPEGSTELQWTAIVSFLVAGAPHRRLKPGQKFSLFEGARTVAHGEIVG